MAVAEDVGIELYGRVALALETERRSALHCRWRGLRQIRGFGSHSSRPKEMLCSLAMLMITNVVSDISRDSA